MFTTSRPSVNESCGRVAKAFSGRKITAVYIVSKRCSVSVSCRMQEYNGDVREAVAMLADRGPDSPVEHGTLGHPDLLLHPRGVSRESWGGVLPS